MKKVNRSLKIQYYFSNSSKISKLGQKAILASKLIEQIARPRSTQQIKNGPLTKNLIKTINENKVASQQAKNEFISLFTTGIPINTKIFDQERHRDQIYNGVRFKDDEAKMIFSPTSIVTGQIFRKMINCQKLQTYNIFMGHYGVSNSISLQLYWYLSNIISEYRVESMNSHNRISLDTNKMQQEVNRKQKEVNILSQKEVNILSQKEVNILSQDVKNYPKLIYLNINSGDSIESMRNKILTQCKQLGDIINNEQILDSSYSTKRIRDFYKTYQIQTILAVDQLHVYADLLKTHLQNKSYFSEVIKPLQQKLKQQALTQQQQRTYQLFYEPLEYKQRIKTARKVTEFRIGLSYLVRNFTKFVYFSSTILQQKILSKLNLAFTKHNTLYHKRVSYLELLSQTSTMYQIVDYFLFQIQQRFSLLFQQHNYFLQCIKTNIVRQILFRHLAKKSQQYILTPYLISIHLIENRKDVRDVLTQIIQSFEKKKTQCPQSLSFQEKVKILEPLLQKLYEVMDSIIISTCLDLTRQFSAFLNKLSKEDQFKLVNQILFKYFKTYNSTYILSRFQLNLYLAQNGVQIFKSCVDQTIYYQEQYGKIYCFYPKKLLLNIVQPIKNASILYMLNNSTQYSIEHFYKQDKSGRYFQKLFIEALSIQNIQIYFQSIKTKFTPFDSNPLGFIPLPQTKQQMQNFNFLQSFSKYAQYLNNKSDKEYTLFLPLNPQYQNQQFIQKLIQGDQKIYLTHTQQKSKCIDFVIIRNPIMQDKLIINCFGLTISTSSVQTQITNFIESYEHFSKNTLSSINWQGEKKQVLFNFYVISGQKDNKELKQNLENKFKGRFRFVQSPQTNIFKVIHITQLGQKTVGRVGNLYLGKQDLKITDSTVPKEDMKNIEYFDKLMKVIEKQQKKQYKRI